MRFSQWRAILVTALACGGMPPVAQSPCSAHVSMEGVPPFNFSALWLDRPRQDQPGRFIVFWEGTYADTAVGRVSLHLPAGVELVSGDTAVAGHPGGEGFRWEVRVRCPNASPVLIRGEMWVNNAWFGVDEGEFELPCGSAPESLANGRSRMVREENVRRGQRFRYGGFFLVPIDSAQRVTEKEIGEHGTKAQVLMSSPVVANISGAAPGDTLTSVVFVKPDGTVRDLRLFARYERNAALVALIKAEVSRTWRFQPAGLRGVRYDDWVLIRVPIAGP